jgi:sodium-coupled neutral amino acid transporter 11
MLKNMDALKTTSILGLGGIAYCALFMAVRLFDGTYRDGGKYFADLTAALKPSFGVRSSSPPPHIIFVLISMISTAYVAHYNAPKFWVELKNKTASRYNSVVAMAFGFAFAMYMTVMWAGFLTFGGHSTGFILNNYSPKDKFATFARLCIGLAILFGYPLTFSALREGALDLVVGVSPADPTSRAKATKLASVVLMTLITALALVLKNVGIVVSFSGALIGAMLIYTVPAIMNICDLKAAAVAGSKSNKTGSKALSGELMVNYGMAVMGCVIAVIGVATTLLGASGH